MIRYLRGDFKADEAMEVDGGATIEEGSLVGYGEIEGVGDMGCARMSKGLQLRHGPLPMWAYMAVMSGKVRLETPDETLVFEAGSTFFIPAGCAHTETVLEDNTVIATVMGPFDDPSCMDDYSVATVDL